MTASAPALVQLGATRDGLDPYRDAAAARGLPAVLVETPAYLAWRGRLGRAPFDEEIAVRQPHDPAQVLAALRDAAVRPAVLLAGFERYAAAAFDAAATLSVPPALPGRPPFRAPDKARQRALLTALAPQVRQPRHSTDGQGAGVPYPRVVKPVDGGGGLGVHLVEDEREDHRARRLLARTANYGGGAFTGVLTEEYVSGTEYSVQGVAHDGRAHVLSVCEKIVLLEPETGGAPGPEPGPETGPEPGRGPRGFREAGHLMLPPSAADPGLCALAQRALTATGYRDGPFHLDAVAAHDGGLYFLEMGYRLSGGGLVALVERAVGARWADLALAAHLGEEPVPHAPRDRGGPFYGQLACTHPGQVHRAGELARAGARVTVLPAAPVPPEASLDPAHAAVLASDRKRHAAVLGRVVVRGEDPDAVRRLLTDCATLPTRVSAP
ncbi:ATP-grasp domain-containing protein [Streptomyces sp. NPDC000963]